MDETADCQLTVKDVSILETMLHRHGDREGPFARLLRRKLASATIVLNDAVDPHTATINSRIELSVNGGPTEHRLLVYGGEDAYPGIALPITTVRGLALLGLTAPASIVCELLDGATERIRLHAVLHQPEAARKHRLMQPAVPESAATILAFGAHRRFRRPSGGGPGDPDGDDPGPEAA